MKKLKLFGIGLITVVVVFCMGAELTTTISNFSTLYQNTDVAGSPDTTLLTGAPTTAFTINAISGSTNFVDLLHPNTRFKGSRANAITLIFTHSHATDADGTTSVFELWGQNLDGPRQAICSIALTAGKAEVVASTDENTWVDTAVVTSYHATTITVADSAADRVVSVTLDVTGFRYLQGLFTGGGSTAVIATAYYRYY